MIPKKGTLKFLRGEGWVIFTSNDIFLRVHKDIILDFGLKKTIIITELFIILISIMTSVSGLMNILLALTNQ